YVVVFFFNDTATTEIYPLSLHDALPIFPRELLGPALVVDHQLGLGVDGVVRSEEHTSELQSHLNLVCRRLLEKQKQPPGRPGPDRPGRTAAAPVPPTRTA